MLRPDGMACPVTEDGVGRLMRVADYQVFCRYVLVRGKGEWRIVLSGWDPARLSTSIGLQWSIESKSTVPNGICRYRTYTGTIST
jgi:hypothetical protein